MKIKVKKQLNLLDLIEHIKKKNIVSKVFYNTEKRGSVIVSIEGDISIYTVNLSDTFEVEVEEELNMETDIPVLIEFNRGEFQFRYDTFLRESKNCNSDAFYILNNDMTMTLVWTRDGGLVQ
ncbi:hypothetical protein [Staphylococcus felis]|uniref:hypothetical protein n=1 Tax=Staphylococcus felis TaxID=46127 RepID=UPI00247FAABA|nr:hypothetical protein [Staphylococcus felis]